MAKMTLRDTSIDLMKKDDIILLEGIMQSMSLYKSQSKGFNYKYVFTDKGVYTKSPKVLFFKSKEGFLPYSSLLGYNKVKYGQVDSFIFLPNNGSKPGTRIIFDNTEAVQVILDKYLNRLNKDQK